MKNYIKSNLIPGVMDWLAIRLEILWAIAKPALIAYCVIRTFKPGGSIFTPEELAIIMAILAGAFGFIRWLILYEEANEILKSEDAVKQIAAVELAALKARQAERFQKNWDHVMSHYDEWRAEVGVKEVW